MKALNSFPSKVLVQNLGSASPRIPFPVHVSDRPELCFTLDYSGNYNKALNFCLLKQFQNKGIIHPIHALPSENQQVELGLEHVESQDQENEQTNESKFVRVAFQLQKDCDFGDQFLIVGDEPILGLWNPSDALPMTWSDGHIWTVELDVPAGKSVQYKFILKGKEGDIIWQPGTDRIIQTLETMNRITVCEDWENAELQTIIEEDKLSQPNEEPQLLPELSTSAEILNKPQEELESNISIVEGTQIHAEQKPFAEPDDLKESTSREKNKGSTVEKIEESADGPRSNVIDDLGYNGNVAAALKNQEETIVESSLFDLEEGPVLVPGLIPPIEELEEAGPSEVEEKTTTIMETSIEAFETQEDQNIPEFSKEQESNDGTPQEINATIIDESELTQNLLFSNEQESNDGTPQEINATIIDESELVNDEHEEQFHLAPAMEDGSNVEPIYSNALQNDINWGRETVKKFLTKLGLL